jgi:hypothetical protein
LHACAQLLLSARAAVDAASKGGSTPLWIACQQGKPECVRLLCEAKAVVDRPMEGGFTPLVIACQFGHSDVVQLLLDAHADALAKSPIGGYSAREAAHKSGDARCIALLDESRAKELGRLLAQGPPLPERWLRVREAILCDAKERPWSLATTLKRGGLRGYPLLEDTKVMAVLIGSQDDELAALGRRLLDAQRASVSQELPPEAEASAAEAPAAEAPAAEAPAAEAVTEAEAAEAEAAEAEAAEVLDKTEKPVLCAPSLA